MNIGLTFLGILMFLTSAFMILLILVQRGKGGGLTGALGGMGGQSAFGAKAGDVFTRVTVVTAIIWITLCMITIAAFNPPPRDIADGKKETATMSSTDDESDQGPATNGDADNPGGNREANSPANVDAELEQLLSGDEAADSGDRSVNDEKGPQDKAGADEGAGTDDDSGTIDGPELPGAPETDDEKNAEPVDAGGGSPGSRD